MMTPHTTAPGAPDDGDDAELQEFEGEFVDGPPVTGVMLLLAPLAVVLWVGIALGLMTLVDRWAGRLW